VISTLYCTHCHLSTKIFSILGTSNIDLKKSHRIFNLNSWSIRTWRDHLYLHVTLAFTDCSISSSDSQYLTQTTLFHIIVLMMLHRTALLHDGIRLAQSTTKPLFENANFKFSHEQILKAAKMKRTHTHMKTTWRCHKFEKTLCKQGLVVNFSACNIGHIRSIWCLLADTWT